MSNGFEANPNAVGRIIDATINVAMGLALIFIGPVQIRRLVAVGKINAERGKQLSLVARIAGAILILYGVYKFALE